MAGIASEEAQVGRLTEGVSSGQRCQSAEALAEWRSSDQVENGTPSTSPPYWDTDDDDDGGPKPSELYGKYTWKIEKFSQINKRELRSNTFEVGSNKWYILIYPQGCDVCNHLSLFLCVADHDKLLPGWSHFAQFTIAVVNKDPKKSKYSDTLHRFWKKEHDWGWKKFMELSKVSDGFLDTADTLIIKAQVQVIREKSDRPFHCLDYLYRRELIRVYLTNVEQICWRFVEERRGKLVSLMDDKDTWSSFCSFWSGMDWNTRHCMSREKADSVLKVVVKHFFIEKEVTSTLVMDSLYSGLKALESQTKSKGRAKLLEVEEIPAPLVSAEKDMFVLVDDVLMLIARAAMEPWPPKDEKGPQNRTKDGNLGEDFNKDSIERDERRLTELGRRTMEIFILAHIFNQKIEVAYQEAIALKRQEELIREEELAAWLAESDQKGKRGATEKEKKLKKKQAKQKRNNRKGKENGREDRSDFIVLEKLREENPSDELKGSVIEEELAAEKPDILEDVSDVSDSVDDTAEVLQPDLEDRDVSPVNWDTDALDVHPPTGACSSKVGTLSPGTAEKNTSVMDDSSSTCSTDSVPSVVMNGSSKRSLNNRCERSLTREKGERSKLTCDGSWTIEMDNRSYGTAANSEDLGDDIRDSKDNHLDSKAGVCALPKRMIHTEQHVVKKEEEVFSLQMRSRAKDTIHGRPEKEKMVVPSASRRSPPKNLPATTQLKGVLKIPANVDLFHIRRASPRHSHHPRKTEAPVISLPSSNTLKPEMQTASVSKLPERPAVQHGAVMSKPSSAPQAPVPRPVASVVSKVQSAPTLAHSVSASGRGGPDPSPSSHSYAPQSYRNAVVGSSLISNSSTFAQGNSGSSEVSSAQAPTGPPSSVSAPMVLPLDSDRVEPTSVHSSYSYGLVNRDVLQNGTRWMNGSQRDENRGMLPDPPVINGYQNLDFYRRVNNGCPEQLSMQTSAISSGRQSQVVVTDEFPHLDIINDLLDDEHSAGMAAGAGRRPQSFGGGSQFLTRQFSLTHDPGVPSELGSSTTSGPYRFDRTKSYQDGKFRRSYSQSDNLSEFLPQASLYAHGNGHIDGLMPRQWQIARPDLLVGMMNADGQTSPYLNSDYLNLACGTNAYPFFQPSNGL